MEMGNNALVLVDNQSSMEMDEMINQESMDVDATDNHAATPFTPTTPLAITDNSELIDSETQTNKRRRKKSIVWEHFTIETVGPGCTKACCKHCKKSFAYINGSKLAGTSHLKRHIALGICPVSRQNNTQFTQASESKNNSSGPPKKRPRASPGYTSIPLDQDNCYHEMAKMIIMHEYPLHMVEHTGFIGFARALQPQFNMASFNTIHGDCVAMYLLEKQKLFDLIGGTLGRVNLTLDLWTSNQSVGYVFLTGHFIDNEWNLHRRLLNVLMVPSPDSDSAFNQPVAACLSDWHLERKLFSLTVDQSIADEMAIGNLRGFLSVRDQHVLNGQLVIRNCFARVISRMAQDALGAMEGTIKKVRSSVKYVKTNDSHEDRFYELKQQLQVPSTKDVFLDDQTKWNTTYHMLVAAHELQEVFSCLGSCDHDYKMAPSVEEWKQIEILCQYLKLLFDAANILTGPTYPTANAFYHEVTKVQLELTHAAMSEDPFVSSLTKPLKEKFDKYWNDCFLVLSIAVVMDPRFKMKLIEFSFSKIYGEDAGMWIKTVDDGIHDLYMDYASQYFPLLEAYVDHANDGISETEMSQQVRFAHGLPDEDHPPNGILQNHTTDVKPQDIQSQDSRPPNGQPQGHHQSDDQPHEGHPLGDYQHLDHQPQDVHMADLQPQDGHTADLQPQEGPTAEVQPQEGQTAEVQPQEGQTAEVQPQEGHTAEGQPQEVHTAEEGEPQEGHMAEGQPQDGHTAEEGQPQDGHTAVGQPQECQPAGLVSQEGQPADMVPQEGQPAEALPQESQPADTMSQEGQPAEAVPQESQQADTVSEEGQQADAVSQEGQQTDIVSQESQQAGMASEEGQPEDMVSQEGQQAEALPQESQPADSVSQEGQKAEALPKECEQADTVSQEGQQADMVSQEGQQSDTVSEEDQQADTVSEEGQQADTVSQESQPADMMAQDVLPSESVPPESHAFQLPQAGHHSDVMLEEGQHLEAASNEFPLITIGDSFSDFELYISEITSHQQMKSELDQYLEESLMPRSQDFDILGWWKLNRTKYPTLSKMASDILSVPFSTVTPDSVFETKIKKMDTYRSSLRPVTLEALICAKDWFQYGSSAPEFQSANLKMES